MNIPEDFKKFIELLNEHDVHYLVVGGYAVSFYSRPKFTNDIDIWIESSLENAEKVIKVLREFGFGDLKITNQDLLNPNLVIQLGYAPIRIDVLMGIKGLEFSAAFKNKVSGKYMNVDANFLSLPDLVTNKRACGRAKDRQDLKWLKKYSSSGS